MKYNKFLVATLSATGVLLATVLSEGDAQLVMNAVAVVLGALGVYRVPNKEPEE
jgi:uncharacterized membrane protein